MGKHSRDERCVVKAPQHLRAEGRASLERPCAALSDGTLCVSVEIIAVAGGFAGAENPQWECGVGSVGDLILSAILGRTLYITLSVSREYHAAAAHGGRS